MQELLLCFAYRIRILHPLIRGSLTGLRAHDLKVTIYVVAIMGVFIIAQNQK